jgi:hypothetical protein
MKEGRAGRENAKQIQRKERRVEFVKGSVSRKGKRKEINFWLRDM